MDLFPHVWDGKKNTRDQPLTPSYFKDRAIDLSRVHRFNFKHRYSSPPLGQTGQSLMACTVAEGL